MSSVYIGAGQPSGNVGQDGDYYLDNTQITGGTPPGSTSPGSTSPGSTSPGSTSPGSTSPGSTSPGAFYVKRNNAWQEQGTLVPASGTVTIPGGLLLPHLADGFSGLYQNATATLSLDNSGNVNTSLNSLAEQFYVKYISSIVRGIGDGFVLRAATYGITPIIARPEELTGGRSAATARLLFNSTVEAIGILSEVFSKPDAQFKAKIAEDWIRTLQGFYLDVDSVWTNIGISLNSYMIERIKEAIGWNQETIGTGLTAKLGGWARQLGRHVSTTRPLAVVIGTGAGPGAQQQLTNAVDNSVVLGAGSDKPSIVISPGVGGAAGSVAIGHETSTKAQGTGAQAQRAVVIGSGAGPGTHQLTSTVDDSVVLGAGSEKPSLVISPGAWGVAGSVAIGHETSTKAQGTGAQAQRAVVIGSGAGAGAQDQLTNAVTGSVVLGASSGKPSIVISPGARGRAGSVAIGDDAAAPKDRSLALGNWTKADADESVVIGSGVGSAAQEQLTNTIDNSVVLGTHSNRPSIVISPGAQDRAGSVAIGDDAAALKERSLALGHWTKADADDTVVIGTGAGATAQEQLTNTVDNSVVLGAGSEKPSIVISPGTQGRAGSVAIGQDAAAPKARSLALGHWTKADADDSVVIGSGAGAGAQDQLTNAVTGSVVLGTHSNRPSIVISPGAQGRAGSVAIGEDAAAPQDRSLALGGWTKADAADSVVIGSGAGAQQPLTNAVDNAVVLGAHSDKPSIVIAKGDAQKAGSVAIGEDAAAPKDRSLALGRWTKADAADSVVIGSGAGAQQPLTNTVDNAVVLGAHSDKPSIIILPANQGQAGKIKFCADVEPAASVSFGNRETPIKAMYVSNESIHIIGDSNNETTISYDMQNKRLKLQAVGADELALTGGRFRSLPDDANFVALDRSGKFFLSDEVKNQVQKAKDSADAASHSEQNASRSAGNATTSATEASTAATAAGTAATAAAGSMAAAAGSAVAAFGSMTAAGTSATAAAGSMAAAAGSAVAALGSMTVAGVSAATAEEHKKAAESAVSQLGRNLTFGPWTKSNGANALVVGVGVSETQPLTNSTGNSVVLGAHSNLASIRISPGALDQAGSVAIGEDAAAPKDRSLALGHWTKADASGSVVIGSGAASQQPLTSADKDSVVLGAGSSKPSIVISPGRQGAAGSVAVGHEITVAQAQRAVVIGSGAGPAQQQLTARSNSVVLGAGSPKASIVIEKGDGQKAGSVAIGEDAAAPKDRSLALGHWTKADADDSVVIGSGESSRQPLTSADKESVVLGAHSNRPSIVISPGRQGEAGSVAIGGDAAAPKDRSLALGHWTKADASGSVVIGSGAASQQPLTSADKDSVVLGAGSSKPSIVISPGRQGGEAGSVAIGGDAAAPGDCSLALGHWTKADASRSVVIGSGAGPQQPLTSASVKESVVLGAGSSKPSIVISPGGAVVIGSGSGADRAQQLTARDNSVVLGAGSPIPSIVIAGGNKDTPGAVSIHTDLVPESNNAHLLGNDRNRWKRIYATEGIEIGAVKGTISYDTKSSRLKLNDVSVDSLAITGRLGSTTPNDTKFIALDGRGNFVLTDLVRDNHQLLLNEIERLSRRVESLEVENDYLKALFTYDLSWEKISVGKPLSYSPKRFAYLGWFVGLSEGYVTISVLEKQEDGLVSGRVCTFERRGPNMVERMSWAVPHPAAMGAYDYAQECRPIATDGAGNLYVLSRRDGVITVYPNNISGASAQSWHLNQQGGRPEKLVGIAVDRAGQNVYVTFSNGPTTMTSDPNVARDIRKTPGGVMKYRTDGTFLLWWSTENLVDNLFTTTCKPTGIAVDDAGMVYVAEEDLNRVQKFRSDGTFVDLWGSSPRVDLNAPIGVAVDSMGCIYLSERDTGLIKKLKLSGDHDLLATWDAKAADGNIRTVGFAVDRVGNVYLPGGFDYFYQGKQTWRLR